MDPYEQRLRDEVIYLHPLWHKGPPRNPNPAPFPPGNQPHFPLQHCSSSSNPRGRRKISSNPLHVSNNTSFKREVGFKGNWSEMAGKDGSLTAAAEPSDGGKEWPVPEPKIDPSPGYSEWVRAKPDSSRKLSTMEEAARLAVLQMQQRVSDSFRGLLARTAGSDSDAADEEDDGDDVANEGWLEGTEEYKFFLDVFVKDRELRDYYEQHSASGEFCCFVCCGDRMHWKKKTKSCEGLLQHAMLIAKTSRRRAHRALGMVICKVLGWDVNRLPVIVANHETLSRSLASAGDVKCETKESTGVSENVSPVAASGLLQCESKETLGVKKDDAGAADSDTLQCERVENAGIVKNGPGVADSSIEDVNVNHENDEREKGQDLDHKRKNNEISISEDSVPLCTSGAAWPCADIRDGNDPATSEWPSVKLPSDLVDGSISDEENEKLAAELKILVACRDFFHCKYGPEYNEEEDQWDWMDEEEEEEEEDNEEDEDEMIDGECEEFEFFVKLFTENANLRSYYESSHGDGDFLCLVCGAVRKKAWRRFKGCIGLLHHSNTIWKVKKKAHRAYARVVCKVLGWDNDALPKIVGISETLGQSLAKSGSVQDLAPLSASGAEWPCKDITDNPNAPTSEWPSLKPPSEPVSAEEEEKLAAEQKVLEACRNFFHSTYGPELDEDEDDVDEEDDSMDEDNTVGEQDGMDGNPYRNSGEYKFFLNLFTEDEKLRNFYVNNRGTGDFCCLVCAAVDKKAWKRYKGCSGLLNHSNTFLETKITAHRAYARAVCKILSWDIEQLPRIVTVSEPLSRSLSNSDDVQGELKVNDLQESNFKQDSENPEPKEHP